MAQIEKWFPIQTERLLLREFIAADEADVHEYAGDPIVSQYTDWGPNSPELTRQKICERLQEQESWPRDEVTLAIELCSERKLIGAVRLHISDRKHGLANFGFALNRRYWGNGYATEATTAVLAKAFSVLKLHRITATCDSRNVGSARVMQKAGMRREAVFRQDVFQKGEWRNSYLYAKVDGQRGTESEHAALASSVNQGAGVALPFSNTLLLRAPRLTDAEGLARQANNRNVWINLRDRMPYPYSVEDAREYIGMIQDQNPRVNFIIDLDGEAIGGIGLVLGTDIERCAAEVGYWLGSEYWGRGIATAALKRICRYAFEGLGLLRVFATPIAWNPASFRVLEKAGFQQEGIIRNACIKDGKVMDMALYAKIACH